MNTKLMIIGCFILMLIVSSCTTGLASKTLSTGEIDASTKSVKTPGITKTPALPDLTITDVSWSPVEPKLGDKVTFQVTVKNLGEYAADGEFLVFLRRSYADTQGVQQTVRGLAAGKSTVVSFTTVYNTQGDHTITAIVDFTRTITEITEVNNMYTITNAAKLASTKNSEGKPIINVVSY